jgi:hypothetical protein
MSSSLCGGAIEAGSVGEGKASTTLADFSARHDTKSVFDDSWWVGFWRELDRKEELARWLTPFPWP